MSVHGVTKSWIRLSNFTFTFHFHSLETEMAAHSSVLAWRIPGMVEPGGLLSMGSHRVRNDWSDLAAAAAGIKVLLEEGSESNRKKSPSGAAQRGSVYCVRSVRMANGSWLMASISYKILGEIIYSLSHLFRGYSQENNGGYLTQWQ